MLATVFIALLLLELRPCLLEFLLLSGLVELECVELDLGLGSLLGLFILFLLLDGGHFEGIHLLLVLFSESSREAQLLVLLLSFLLFLLNFLAAGFVDGPVLLALEGLEAGLRGIRLVGLLLDDFKLRFKVLKPRILVLLGHVLLELIGFFVQRTHSRGESLRELGGVEVLLGGLAVLGDLGEMRLGRIGTLGFHYVSKLYQFKYIAGKHHRLTSDYSSRSRMATLAWYFFSTAKYFSL